MSLYEADGLPKDFRTTSPHQAIVMLNAVCLVIHHQVVAELTGAKTPGEFQDAYIPPIARNNKRR